MNKLKNTMRSFLEEANQRRQRDKIRWETLNRDMCMVCETEGFDRRTLLVDCFYALNEASEKFIDLHLVEGLTGFALRICKGCRARFMQHLAAWINEKGRLADSHLDDNGIFSYSEAEFRKMYPEKFKKR